MSNAGDPIRSDYGDLVFEPPRKSISEMRKRFCDMWRRSVSDDEFLDFIREITADETRVTHNHKLNHLRKFFLMNPGEEYYEINTDTLYKLTK